MFDKQMVKISRRIKGMRRSKLITQEAAAKAIVCTPCTYSKRENGGSEWFVKDLLILADLFGCTVSELIGE